MDEETKAELLTFLVVGQLLAYARCREWLRTDHMIESCLMWMSSNGAHSDWLDRAKLVEASRPLAEEALASGFPRDETGLLRLFNLDGGWFLDYRSSVVQKIHMRSLVHLGIEGG